MPRPPFDRQQKQRERPVEGYAFTRPRIAGSLMQKPDRRSDEFDFDDYIGAEFLSATKDRVVGRLVARQQHLTGGERIHGGLIVAFAETLAGRGSDTSRDVT